MGKWCAAIAVLLLSSSAFAARDDNGIGTLSVAHNGQTATKKECTKAAGKRKGDERKAFIEGCLWSTHKPKRN